MLQYRRCSTTTALHNTAANQNHNPSGCFYILLLHHYMVGLPSILLLELLTRYLGGILNGSTYGLYLSMSPRQFSHQVPLHYTLPYPFMTAIPLLQRHHLPLFHRLFRYLLLLNERTLFQLAQVQQSLVQPRAHHLVLPRP
jgi:hypothetical protein